MKLTSTLTVGWETGDFPAVALDKRANKGRPKEALYATRLLEALGERNEVDGVEELFHRRVREGSRPIKRFAGALAAAQDERTVTLHIDVFAYVFLARASNLDFVFPEEAGNLGPFRKNFERRWRKELLVYENFERLGEVPEDARQQSRFLAMRAVLSRPSARDELRALAALLWSGPLTPDELREELALNWPLGERVLAPFLRTQILERRAGAVAISTEAIPVVLFFLRELLGIDPLTLI